MSRRVVIVAPQFPPSNLTAGHRTRLFLRHLPEFGYEPTVLTVQPRFYEEHLDQELESLVPQGVFLLRTRALPTRPVRLVGDLGIRSFPFHLLALRRLAREGRIDLLYLPIPPNYSSLLGPLAKWLWGVPYVIDYIDPWVYPITQEEWRSPKARLTHRLARWLEPWAARDADGVTGVAEGYYAGVLQRHPHLRGRPSAAIPYGGEALDHEYAAKLAAPARLVGGRGLEGSLVVAYAGALLPRAHGAARALFRAARRLVESGGPLASRLRLLFVGTGARPNDPGSGLVAPLARECGADGFTVEIADRQPYLDILSLLHAAQAVLILGSSEAAYTASKTFQALHSRRPVLALLHEASSASAFLREMPGIALVTFRDDHPVECCEDEIAAALRRVLSHGRGPVERPLGLLEKHSAREMSRRLAAFFDEVLGRCHQGGAGVR
jgi:hypothetical protein